MKKNYLLQKAELAIFLLSMVFLQMFNMKVYATHMAGADLTYRYLGNNQYELNYTFYRDCVGISAQTSIDITYSSLTCGINSIVTLFPFLEQAEITWVCPGATTTCNGGTEPGIQKWEYSEL